MAQFVTLLPVILLLLAVFNPIVCPSSTIMERRDRGAFMESRGHGTQYIAGSPIPVPPALPQNAAYNEEELKKKIENIFHTSTDYGPGVEKNTPLHSNSYDGDYMQGDQPQPQAPSSSSMSSPSSSTEPGFFKVQRSPTGKLGVVYSKDYVPSKQVDASAHPANDRNSSSDNVEQTHRTDSPPPSPVKTNDSTEHPGNKTSHEPPKTEINYTVDSNDCVENEEGGKPFCTNLLNYPERTHLEQIIKKKFSNLEIFFGEDLVVPQNISQRMNNEPNEEFLCRSRTRIIYPQAGLNKDYNWLIIVNIPNYKQGIRIEECITENSTCGEDTGLMLPNRFTATCKQSYIYRSLVAYTNETVIRDNFKMPSCCKCVLRTG